MKAKNKSDIHFHAESIIGGKTGVLQNDDREYKIEVKEIAECTEACPAGVNVKAYVNLIANRRFEDAIGVIRKANPFPAVCGRVCTRPCEDTCELGVHGDSIPIRALKRYASDYELARRPLVVQPCKTIFKEKVAIIGAGPAGLTAAVDLIRLGYPVTVFEAEKEPGGLLRYAIPPYRLPDRILKREIDWIKGLGIEIKTGRKIKDPIIMFKDGFSAVLIAGGAWKSFPLGIDGEKSEGVIDALKLLREISECRPRKITGNVVVIGGGSTAFDASRSSLRLGAKKVTLAYRRGIEEMPAEREEIEAAQEEGVEILTLAIPNRITARGEKVTGIEFLKAELGDPDESGRRMPVPIKNSEFTVKTDYIIPAVGAMPDVGFVGEKKVTTPKGLIDASENGQTIVEGVFAAGDIEMGPSSVVDAIGRGHAAAGGIHTYLKKITPKKKEELEKSIQISLGPPLCSRFLHATKRLVEPEKVRSFVEVEGSFTDFEAVEEASRCFSCGPCYACPVCLPNCKNKQLVAQIEDADFLVKAPLELSQEITRNGPAEFTLRSDGKVKDVKLYSLTSNIDPNLCISCSRCEEVCAYKAIKNIFKKDQRIVLKVTHDPCASCSACVSECPGGAITQGYMSDNEILSRLEAEKTPYMGIKSLMSFWSTTSPFFGAYDGIVELMSERKPSPMFLIRALARTGKGLLVIKPDETTGSHYLPWEEPPSEVVQNTWDLLMMVGISPDRIKYQDLPRGEKPTVLLKEFNKQLDEKNLGMLKIPIPKSIDSPFGEAIAILRILGANPDMNPRDGSANYRMVRPRGIAFFEGCLPLLHMMGKAHKLFDLGPTRHAICKLIEKTKIDAGAIEGFSCPSKGLLNTEQSEMDEIVSSIASKNLKAFKKVKPVKLILGTPEAFLSFSRDKDFRDATSALPDEFLNALKKNKGLIKFYSTVAVHPACKMEKDPFYESTIKLLKLVPGVEIVELEGKCGHNGFNNLSGESKDSAIDLMNEAASKGADMLICTSPYCESHLLMCNREGSWRTVDIKISDVYRLLYSALQGDI